ncbi:MAG: TonB-dependent receptor domain-containing protein [Janthinobacterium lividum]
MQSLPPRAVAGDDDSPGRRAAQRSCASVQRTGSTTFYNAKRSDVTDGSAHGNHVTDVSSFAFNLGVDYDLPWVPGLGVDGRIIHNGAQYHNGAAELRVPSWTRCDVGARYQTQIARKSVVLRANIENLFGSRYWLQKGS